MPAISPTLNDGVVNTVRQIVPPGRREEVGGFVVADHGDVLGHYDRQDALIGGKPYNAGLFHSGAAFGDDEFFARYRRVAQAILKTIPGAHREEETELERGVDPGRMTLVKTHTGGSCRQRPQPYLGATPICFVFSTSSSSS